MNSNVKKLLVVAALGAMVLVIAEPSFAQQVTNATGGMTIPSKGQSLGTVATNIVNSLKGVTVLITMLCYMFALIFMLAGIFKFKAYGDAPDRHPLKTPLIYWGLAVMCAAFPEFLGTGISTIWSTGTGGAGPAIVQQP